MHLVHRCTAISIFVLISFVSFLSSTATAQDVSTSPANPTDLATLTSERAVGPLYTEYYTINEKNPAEQEPVDFSNLTLSELDMIAAMAKKTVLSLLAWHHHEQNRPQPTDTYIRKLHFGRWINDPTDETCMNTRAKVLVRESEGTVTYRNNKNCVVDKGVWTDNYSAKTLEAAREIQIDHMVPLKHAYLAGAYGWDYKTRCLYANYLGYRNHLVAASVHENTSKGDRGPDKYMPSNQQYHCQYVKDWLTVKLIWRLNMTPDEVAAIDNIVEQNSCDLSQLKVTQKDLETQRSYINGNLEYCMSSK